MRRNYKINIRWFLVTIDQNVCMYACMYVCMWCMYVCMYVTHVCMYVYIYAYMCIYLLMTICACAGTHFCLYKSTLFICLSCRYLGCYLSVWHYYLGSILAFSSEFHNLTTTISTKTFHKSTYTVYSPFCLPTIIYDSWVT